MSQPERQLRSFPAFAAFALTLTAAAAVVGLVGLVRLGRQFPAAASSPALLVPFLLPVLALALEAGVLVAVSAVQLRIVAPFTSPLATAAVRARVTGPLLGLLAVVLVLAELIPRGTEHPGAFANELVQSARASCDGTASRSVPVPLLGLSVSCGEPRRIEGPMPGVRSIQVAMRELRFSDDLRRVDIVGLELSAARQLRVHLTAGSARIAGLAPWSRSPRLTPAGRFAILAALGLSLWVAVNVGWPLPTPPPSSATAEADAVTEGASVVVAPDTKSGKRWMRLLAYLLCAVPGALVAACFISLDQDRAAPLAYGTAALLGLAALGGLRVLNQRVPLIFSSFRAF
jgi:hypothetical protein